LLIKAYIAIAPASNFTPGSDPCLRVTGQNSACEEN
jgi:hypothetical protein